MTKTQFKRKTLELIKNLDIYKECERLFDSGGIEPDDYDDNYELPKIILTVALNNVKSSYYPTCISGREEIENLRHF